MGSIDIVSPMTTIHSNSSQSSGSKGTPYENGLFSAVLSFPKDYPLNPPQMRFTCDIFHPNGTTDRFEIVSLTFFQCIKTAEFVYRSSIHRKAPVRLKSSPYRCSGDDPNQYESSSERWSPVQSVEKILLSVVSMLAEPNVESGANIEACVSFRLLKAKSMTDP